jgi:hypothetical protein
MASDELCLQLPTSIDSVGDTGVLCNVGENNFFKLMWCAILMRKAQKAVQMNVPAVFEAHIEELWPGRDRIAEGRGDSERPHSGRVAERSDNLVTASPITAVSSSSPPPIIPARSPLRRPSRLATVHQYLTNSDPFASLHTQTVPGASETDDIPMARNFSSLGTVIDPPLLSASPGRTSPSDYSADSSTIVDSAADLLSVHHQHHLASRPESPQSMTTPEEGAVDRTSQSTRPESSSLDSFTMVDSSSPRSSKAPSVSQQPSMTKRQHALHELLSSERAYASDLALMRDIHIPLALGEFLCKIKRFVFLHIFIGVGPTADLHASKQAV